MEDVGGILKGINADVDEQGIAIRTVVSLLN